jgi:NAD(P)-dependent dehydrogenase (short-subunit alcohol dehydrogenase family)
VLVTGGARGITTHVTRALLEKTGCTAVLVGRTPEPPAVEPEETAGALDAVALRGLLARRGFGPPARIEAEVARILSVREVRSTLADLRQAGYDVHYRVGDVSGEAEVRRLLDAVRAEFGRLDGIVHAAGVIEDARLVDKSADSFRRVFRTKVTLPCVLGPVLEHGMRFVVLFGSVSGAFGNRGQVDYAAANAALASIARDLSRRFDGRVLTVDWGPWAGGGMVSPGLERELARRGWGLLEPGEAVRLLFDELMAAEGEPEVLIVRADPESIS